jgi:subtilisin-like proprotein convertase family protein/LysM repeat protein
MTATAFELTKRMITDAAEKGILNSAMALRGIHIIGNPIVTQSATIITMGFAVVEGDADKLGRSFFGGLGSITGVWAANKATTAANGGGWVGAVIKIVGIGIGTVGGYMTGSNLYDVAKGSLNGVNLNGVNIQVSGVDVPQSYGYVNNLYNYITSLNSLDQFELYRQYQSGDLFNVQTNAIVKPDPDAPNGNYTVEKGDTLWALSLQQGCSVKDIMDANPQITDENLIWAGQQINMPEVNATNDFTSTINTTGTTTQTGATDPLLQNANVTNGYIVNDGLIALSGTGDLNFGSGNTAIANYTLSDGYRPGDGNSWASTFDVVPSFTVNRDLAWTNTLMQAFRELAPTDPLVLDLNGDGVKMTDYGSEPVLFDADHDGGSLEQTGWVSAQDGLVVRDLNGDGIINSMGEVFSEYYNGAEGTNGSAGVKTCANGFEALRSLDTHKDGVFDASDAAWNNVKVWVDANHDGKSWNDINNNNVMDAGEASELKSLTELGITQINLTSTAQSGLVSDGNEILAIGTFKQYVDASGNPVSAGTPGANEKTRDAVAANFLSNPNGSTFTETGTGVFVTTQGDTTNAAVKAYASHSTTGEIMDAAHLQVQNLYGGSGDDTLTGDAGINWLAGSQGSDTFNAGAGDDVLIIDADDLSENIHAGAGLDVIQVVGDDGVVLNMAQMEAEIVQGGRGDDVIIGGGTSSVFVRGGDGNDVIIGGAANDALSGEDGDDMIDGGAGNDIIRGHRGKDYIAGGVGDDLIEGGLDDDILNGGTGSDILNGGQGDDKIDGGAGIDVAKYSGSYSDYKIMKTEEGTWITDTVSGRDGTDFLTNVEKLSFKDLNMIDNDLGSPMPVKDILTTDATGASFDRTNTRFISKQQLLQNDIDMQGDALTILEISDVQGGMAILSSAGVTFTPFSSFTGVMGFKYAIEDANHNQTKIGVSGSNTTVTMKAAVYLKTGDIPNDPLVVDQWYLTDANIIPVWKDYTGKGVKIGQFEPGEPYAVTKEVLDYRHPDLQQNIDPDWLADPTNLAGDGSEEKFSTHATLVAGIMVAAKNGEGAVGVAYDATVAGHFMDEGELTDVEHGSLTKMKDFDVVNNSWGADVNFGLKLENTGEIPSQYAEAVAHGRKGLGTVIVQGGGNARQKGGNTNYSIVSNSRAEIVVGAINAKSDLGTLAAGTSPFSNPGASILISAPGSNITSTSRMVENDNGSTFGNDFEASQGTSFATPIVSGIVALMLEANPNLGYRDVQDILALSAKKVDDANTTWQTNDAVNWNGGGMHFSHDYGFGEVDALAAVRLAETWMAQSRLDNENSVATPPSSGTINMAIPDNDATGVSSVLNVNADIIVEHAEVVINLDHANAGDIIVKLIAPNGTESILVNRPGKAPGSDGTDRGDAKFDLSTTLNYVLTTNACRGETAKGNWTLKVIDAASGNTGVLKSWSLNVYGKADYGNDNYVYTNEFASTSGRTTVTDSDNGYDTINAAAVTGDSTLNLNAGTTSTIGKTSTYAGKTLTIAAGTTNIIENAIGGDGNDTITGNARDEVADCYALAA